MIGKKNIFIRIILVVLFCGASLFLYSFQFLILNGKQLITRKRIDRSLSCQEESVRRKAQDLLKDIIDLELGISIVDLGLVRDIKIDCFKKTAKITIIFTAAFCPYADFIIAQIKRSIRRIDGIEYVDVSVERQVVWTEALISEEGKKALERMYK